jgi:hypothetical protein
MRVNEIDEVRAIAAIEEGSGTYADILLGHMLLQAIDGKIKSPEEIAATSASTMLRNTSIGENITFDEKSTTDSKTGKVVRVKTINIDGKEYEFQRIIGDSHSNPLELYMSPFTKEEVLVKSGNDYSMMIEYIGNKLFVLAGLPVPKFSICIDNQGRAKGVMEYMGNYIGNVRRMPGRYRNDLSIKSAILVSMMIGDKDRSPWNMLFMKMPTDVTKNAIENMQSPHIIHIDFGSSMFGKPTSGFKAFESRFTDNPKDFITGVRHGQKTPVNPAYEQALNDTELLHRLSLALESINDDKIDIIVSEAVKAIGYDIEDVVKMHIAKWIEWCRLENRSGFTNRKPRIDRQRSIELFEHIIEYIDSGKGTFADYLAGMLKQRRDDVVAMFKSSSTDSDDMVINDINISQIWQNMIKQGRLTRKAIDPETQNEFEIALAVKDDGAIEYRARNLTEGKDVEYKVTEEIVPESMFIREFNPFEGFAEKVRPRISGRQPDLPDHSQRCGFSCMDASIETSMLNRKPVAVFKVNGELWQAYSKRIFADKRGHLVLIPDITNPENKRGQLITGKDIGAVISMSNESRNTVILYNSLHAGASVNHIHFHLVYHGERLPIEYENFEKTVTISDVNVYRSTDYGIKVIMLEGQNKQEVSSVALGFISRLQDEGIPFNLLIANGKVYIMPRNIENEVVSEFPRPIGIRELYGKFTAYNQTEIDELTKEKIASAFNKLSLTEEQIYNLIDNVSRDIKSSSAGTRQLIREQADRYITEFKLKPNNLELLTALVSGMDSYDTVEQVSSALAIVGNVLAEPSMRLKSLRIIKDAQAKGLVLVTEELKDRIDLHCHTYYSDGWFTPSSVVYNAWKQGMKAIAVVDHNTFDGLYEALKAGEILDIEVFTGIEFDLYDDELGITNFHMIAYLPNQGSAESFKLWLNSSNRLEDLKADLKNLTDRYRAKNKRYIEAFNKKYAGTFELLPGDLRGYLTQMPNRYQIGKALFDKYGPEKLGHREFRFITGKYLPFGMAEMEGRDGLDAESVLNAITQAGGVVVMPHPGERQHNKPPMYAQGQVEQVLNKYAGYIKGVEVYSAKHVEFSSFQDIVERINKTNTTYQKSPLIVTLGSDAHDQVGILIGRGDTRISGRGNLIIDVDSDSIINNLRGLLTDRASSAGTIMENMAQLDGIGRYDYETGANNIKEIMDKFIEISSEDMVMVRNTFVDILEDDKANIFVREMAAYSLRLFAEERIIEALKKVADMPASTDAPKAPASLPEPIQGMNLAEICDYSLQHMLSIALLTIAPNIAEEEAQAVVVYSDALEYSNALQDILRSFEKGQRRYYLVNKSNTSNEELLKQAGVSSGVFDHIFNETDPETAINRIMPVLAHQGISQIRVFALSDEDKIAWSRQRLVDVLLVILKNIEFTIMTPDERNRALYEQDANRKTILIQA